MSTILDALRKASEEREHIRSPLSQGNLFHQSRIEPRAREVAADDSSGHGFATPIIAVAGLLLIATMFIIFLLWVAKVASQQQAANAPASNQVAAATLPPPSGGSMDPAAAAAIHSGNLSQRRVEQYRQTQLQAPAPIPLAPTSAAPIVVASATPIQEGPVPLIGVPVPSEAVMHQDVSRELPPPQRLAVIPDFERNWEAELLSSDVPQDPLPEHARSDGDSSSSSNDESSSRSEEREEPRREARPERDPLTLEGIVWNEDKPMAIIGGSIVGVGDTAHGAQILAISRDSVTVSVDGSEQTLSY